MLAKFYIANCGANENRDLTACCAKSLIMKSGKRGLNPRPSAWEADALPLSYSRNRHKFTFYLSNFGILNKKEEDGCVVH